MPTPLLILIHLFPAVDLTMEYNTSELCDIYRDMVDVIEPCSARFGGRASFGGVITYGQNASESTASSVNWSRERRWSRAVDRRWRLHASCPDRQRIATTAAENGGKGSSATVASVRSISWKIRHRHSGPGGHSGGRRQQDIGKPICRSTGVTFPPDDPHADTTG